MKPYVVPRRIPAKEMTVRIVGSTEHAVPILVLKNTVYEVAGDVKFTPEPRKAYCKR